MARAPVLGQESFALSHNLHLPLAGESRADLKDGMPLKSMCQTDLTLLSFPNQPWMAVTLALVFNITLLLS